VLKTAIAKGLEVLDSGVSEGIESEAYAGETTVKYAIQQGRNALDTTLEPYLRPIISKWAAL